MLPVKDVQKAIAFYTESLQFRLLFSDREKDPSYAGVKREGVELHLQWHDPEEWKTGIDRPMIRILCSNPDILYEEFKQLLHPGVSGIRNTSWGTREFGLYDPDQNALIFYKDL